MKTKDIIALVVAVAIFMVAGYIAYTQLFTSTATNKKQVQVEVVGVISPDFDSGALEKLKDSTKVSDFSVPLDLTGLGNTAVFGR